MLPPVLGKAFYAGGTKRPVPVNLEPYTPKKDASEKPNPFSVVKKAKPTKEDGKHVAPPQQCAREIERALTSALIHLSPAATTSIRVGLSTFSSQQVAANIEAVVNGMVEKHIPNGWRNVKAIHLKGPNTMALPIWLAEELWVDENDVLEAKEAEKAKLLASQKGRKRKEKGAGRALVNGEGKGEQLQIEGSGERGGKKRKREEVDKGLGGEMKAKREKLRKQKMEVRVKEEKLNGGSESKEEGGVKVKRRKSKTVEVV